jgi:hypothetical protein
VDGRGEKETNNEEGLSQELGGGGGAGAAPPRRRPGPPPQERAAVQIERNEKDRESRVYQGLQGCP